MTGNWKTNQGSAMLEQMPITEKYKNWVDEVRRMFMAVLTIVSTCERYPLSCRRRGNVGINFYCLRMRTIYCR